MHMTGGQSQARLRLPCQPASAGALPSRRQRGFPRVVPAIAVLIATELLCAPAHGYERDKSDIVQLSNGNYLTGDIVSMEYGTLALKTDQMGTLRIEWPAVRAVSSKFAFAIEKTGGAKFYGTITTSPDGAALLVTDGERVESIQMGEVERLSRYSRTFWNRINGNLAVGFSFTQASDTTVGSINLDTYYQSTAIDASLSLSSNTTQTANGNDTFRAIVSSTVIFVQQSRNFWGLVGSVERDQELGIDARLLAGAVVGRRLVQMPYMEVTGVTGVVVAQESITSNPEQQTSAEGLVGLEWRVYKFSDPETSLTFGIALYPSLTESDRYRGNSHFSLTHKIAGDFTLGVTGYWTADSHPPDPTARKSDYGMTLDVGYTFGE
jgi:hypothetical protein